MLHSPWWVKDFPYKITRLLISLLNVLGFMVMQLKLYFVVIRSVDECTGITYGVNYTPDIYLLNSLSTYDQYKRYRLSKYSLHVPEFTKENKQT